MPETVFCVVVLPGAVRAEQRDDLALADVERDALEGADRAVAHLDVVDVEHRRVAQLHRLAAFDVGIRVVQLAASSVSIRCSSGCVAGLGLGLLGGSYRDTPRRRPGSRWISCGVPSAIFSPKLSTTMRCGDRHDELHVVLDEQHADVAFDVDPRDQLGEIALLGRVGAGRGLVEQQHTRVRCRAPGRSRAAAARRRPATRPGRWPVPSSPTSRSSASAVVGALASPRDAATACPSIAAIGPDFCRVSMPTLTFSSAVSAGKSRMFWNVRATPRWLTTCVFLPITLTGGSPGRAAQRDRCPPAACRRRSAS